MTGVTCAVVRATGTQLRSARFMPLTCGTTALRVQFLFSDEWAGMTKTVVFKHSGKSWAAPVNGFFAGIPQEALEEAGVHLLCGVTGWKRDAAGNETRLASEWTSLGTVQEGAAL